MAQFFSYPLNYGSNRSQYREVADNDYNTFTDQTSILLNIDSAGDGSGTAREFTDIFIKGTGISSYSAALTDPANITSPQARTLPTSVKNDSGDTVSITDLDGFQNDLHNLWTDENTAKPKAKSVTLTFSGASPRIYEVMVLDRLLTLDSDGGFSRIEYDSLDLGSYEPDLRGRLGYIPPINGERDKWIVNLTLFAPRRAADRGIIADNLLHFIRRYKNFVFAGEYNRYPERVFPAGWGDARTALRYISRWKGAGRRVSFGVREA